MLNKDNDSTDAVTAKEKADIDRYKKYGFDYNKNKDQIAIDDKGNATIIDQNLLNYIQSTGQTDNLWLNDDFNAFTSNAYADLVDAANGGLFVYGGRVYRGNDPRLNQLVQYNDFIAQNKATGGNATNTKQWWRPGYGSGLSNMNFDADGNKVYSPVLNGSFGRDVTGEYADTPGGALIYEYIPNYSSDNAELFDQWGRPLASKRQLVAIDPNTKQNLNWTKEQFEQLQRQNSPDRVNWYYSDKNTGRRTGFQRYYTYGDNNNWIRVGGVGDPNNPGTGYVLFRDDFDPAKPKYYVRGDNPANGNINLISGHMGDAKMSDNLFLVDPKIAEYMIANQDSISQEEYDILMYYLRNQFLTNSSWRTKGIGGFTNTSPKRMEFLNLFNRQFTNNPYAGRSYNWATSHKLILPWSGLQLNSQTPTHKEGGVLMAQTGQKIRETVKTDKESVKMSDEPMRRKGQEKVIGDGLDLNTADLWEIGALAADGLGLGASLVPAVGNVAGAITGGIGSIANFASDWARDGLDMGDFGNLAVNLGLDAATFFGGAAGKALKVAKALKGSGAVAKAVKFIAQNPKVFKTAMLGLNAPMAGTAVVTA